MKELPILFNGAMVRAILDRRKTQTRRPIKPQPEIVDNEPRYEKDTWALWSSTIPKYRNGLIVKSPFGVPGDYLYVREHWGYLGETVAPSKQDWHKDIVYHADGAKRKIQYPSAQAMFKHGPEQRLTFPPDMDDLYVEQQQEVYRGLLKAWWKRQKSKPSIHMPKWASRITLEVERMWVERVQEISEEDALAEGCGLASDHDGLYSIMMNQPHRQGFRETWDTLYAKQDLGWDVNPWIYACEFKVLEVKQ